MPVRNKPVVWSFEAKRNFESIFNHICEHFSRELAIKRIDRILKEVEILSRFPRKGKISLHFNEIRELIVDGNTVYYRNNETEIVVASVRPRRTNSRTAK